MKIQAFYTWPESRNLDSDGCNDDLTQVGTGIQPENDRPLVYADTFYYESKNITD